jgi:hypothetical protein
MGYDDSEVIARDPGVIAGRRVRLSVLGRERCPKMTNDRGTVVGKRGINAVRVLFDGRRHPIKVHSSYVELE